MIGAIQRPLSTISQTYIHAENFYVEKVKNLYHFLKDNQWEYAGDLAATLLLEPMCAIKAGNLMQTSLSKKNLSNLNPTKLTSKQAMYAPVLLIHGDHSNSGLFAPLIDVLTEKNPDRPLFTVDLVSQDGKVSKEQHLNDLVTKVKNIAALYPFALPPKIALVGHSSGGDVIGPLAKAMTNPGALIKIGSVFEKNAAQEFNQYPHGPVLEILGTKDVFEGCKSHLNNNMIVHSPHLGLLFHKAVLNRVHSEIDSWKESRL